MTYPVQRQIMDLLTSVGERLPREKRDDVADLTRHYEWTVGVDVLADALHEHDVALSAAERDSLMTIIASLARPLADYSFLRLDDGRATS